MLSPITFEDMNSFDIVIMAAGRGTRLKSSRPKVLHAVGGKLLLRHVIDAALELVTPSQIHVVVGHMAEQVETAVRQTGVHFVRQPEQLGTGHALQCVKAAFLQHGTTVPENIVVLSGDVPLIRAETIQRLWTTHAAESAAMTVLTAIPDDPAGYGRVLRRIAGSAEITAIVEQKSLTPEQLAAPETLREINSGIYAFQTSALFPALDRLSNANSANEFYLTDVAGLLVTEGARVVAVAADSVDEVLGANTIAEMMHLDASLRRQNVERLMASGVTIFRPETVTIDSAVSVGADTVLEPFTQLLGTTRVGQHCRIRSYSTIENSTLGDRVLVRQGCVLDHAAVANEAVLGPYAHLRPESHIGAGAHVGNFVETKKTTLGDGSKANHLAYLGDAVVGSGVNIGAGVITCNYDGVHKNVTRIGDGVFVGSDSTLVAPLTLEPGSYVAAGSCITDDVPADALALGRARQITKPDWAAKRRASLQSAERK